MLPRVNANTSKTRAIGWLALALLGLSCAAQGDEGGEASAVAEGDEAEVVVKTDTPEQRAQHQANVQFALGYQPQCVPSKSRRRVIVTGYGRFMHNTTNATGQIVSRLVPAAVYPETSPPTPGQVDEPGPQTSVGQATLTLPRSGDIDVCALILPVYWDLAAILVLKEIEAFQPDLVLMNGIAGSAQPLWLELGSVNRAMNAPDGSDLLSPPEGSALIPQAAKGETLRGLRMSWDAVKAGAIEAIEAEQDRTDDEGTRLGDLLTGALFAGFPRAGNTYLCNNIAYTVGYVMDHPGKTLKLLQASNPSPKTPKSVSVRLKSDHRKTAREFMHWPSALRGDNLDGAAAVMRAVIDAQLEALALGDAPTVGSNEQAEIQASGDTF